MDVHLLNHTIAKEPGERASGIRNHVHFNPIALEAIIRFLKMGLHHSFHDANTTTMMALDDNNDKGHT